MIGVELRPYQLAAIERAREVLRRGFKRLVIVAPTGAGKTIIAARIVLSARERGRRVMFVAHRRELIGQTYRKLLEAGIPELDIGVMMADDSRTRPDAPIQIVSIATYPRREAPEADLVIIDECHRSLSPSYVALIKRYSEARCPADRAACSAVEQCRWHSGARVLGLTATPFRANGDGLGDVYERLVLVARPQELIDAGYLVEPRVFSGGAPDLSGVHTRGGDYIEHELQDAMNHRGLVGGIVKHWLRLAEGRRTVAFASGVEHSKAIAAAFIAAGVPAEHLDGSTPTAERDAILARLESGATRVVSNCGVLCEGWDQPSCKALILARPTKSLGLYIQQVGRVLRPWNGVCPIILDHTGNALRHGLPHADREYSLKGAHVARASTRTCECPACHAVIAFGIAECPECGAAFKRPQARERVLAVDAPGELRELRQQRKGPPPSEAQVAALRRAGYSRALLKHMSASEASALLTKVAERRAAGMCTLRQARQLRRFGLPGDVSFEVAARELNAIAANGWRMPKALQGSAASNNGP